MSGSRGKTAISVAGLTKGFGSVTALRDITFRSDPGINIVLGPNGAGKSTLLRCMDGLYRPDSGEVRIFGLDPYYSSEARASMSLVSENYALYDYLTVRDNLKLFGRLSSIDDRATMSAATRILGELDAQQYIGARVHALSRGTKQKIAICRALLSDPTVLLLDEPTAFLDAMASDAVRSLMLRYEHEGRTVVFVTQKLDEVTRFNSRITIMSNGRILKSVDSEDLYGTLLRDTKINIRLAMPMRASAARRTPGFETANSDRPTMLTIRIEDYRGINEALDYLIRHGAYVTSIDFIGPLIERLALDRL